MANPSKFLQAGESDLPSETMNLSAVFLYFLLGMVLTGSPTRGGDAVRIVSPLPPGTAEPPAGDLVSDQGVFDVTLYGAVADGKTENSQAFMAAWEDACAYKGSSVFFIPHGTFFVGPASFAGPCYAHRSPKVVILGTLTAPPTLKSFNTNDDWIQFRALQWLSLTGATGPAVLDGQGADVWSDSPCHGHSHSHSHVLPTSLKFSNVSYGTVSNITLVNSKGFHVGFYNCDNIHLSGFNITAPADSPNTDGIHISHSTNINITTSTVGVGDDCISIGPGSMNVSVSNVTCGPGHGISVGSLGKYTKERDVVGIRVENCVINGTDNGVRVKTWPGDNASNATGLTFESIVMVNVTNPIIIDQQYCPHHPCDQDKPSSVKLKDVYFRNVSGTYNSQFAVTLLCSPKKPCENVQISNVNLSSTQPDDEDLGRFRFKGGVSGFQIVNSRF